MPDFIVLQDLELVCPGRGREKGFAVNGASFSVEAGEVFGLLGAEGAGKSLLMGALSGLLPPRARVVSGELQFETGQGIPSGKNWWHRGAGEWRRWRGKGIAVFGQTPDSEWNSRLTIRQHLDEALALAGRRQDRKTASEWMPRFYEVGVIEPENLMERKPGELPPLVLRRLQLGMALIRGAKIWLVDDPGQGLDAASRWTWLELLRERARAEQAAVVLATRSARDICRAADRAGMIREGEWLEEGTVDDLMASPQHPYTRDWFQGLPSVDSLKERGPGMSEGESTPQLGPAN